MNKIEFLEILKDYLKKDFSEDEINDILRDYEEYFVDGLIEGKNDMEIIEALGSPKTIANELISQMNKEDKSNKYSNDKFNNTCDLFKLRAKENYSRAKNYFSEKLTPNINDENHDKDRKWIQAILAILSVILIIPAIGICVTLIGIGIILFISIVAFLGTMPLAISFIKGTSEVTALYIFASMAFVGGQILAWQIYVFLIIICKRVLKTYINWLKTRNLYINASKRKEKNDKKELDRDFEYDLDYKDNKEGDEKYE